MIADVSKMPHTRATLTANLAAESENNLLLGELLPARAEHWLCMHKVRNSASVTMHGHSKLSEEPQVTLNCTKAALSSRYGLMTLLPKGTIHLL